MKRGKIQTLISTMNLIKDSQVDELVKHMKIETEYLIVNQTKLNCSIQNSNVITKNETGLSKSRNTALNASNAEICILADDDVIYEKDYLEKIKNAYENNKEVDIICFFVESKNKIREIKKIRKGKVGYLDTMRISSSQITFKTKNIKNSIKFDENFGAGVKWDRGEECIFLCDCLRKGLKIIYIPEKIAEIEQKNSTWFKGFSEDFFYKQGAVFARMMPEVSTLLNIQFVIRKRKLYANKIAMIKVFKLMQKGKKDFLKTNERK